MTNDLDVLDYVKNDYNVIVVQWDLGSDNLNYAQSASDTRSVGAYIGLVARNLIQHGGSQRSRLYCVGHSLGAHVCGHAGSTEKFGRISGELMIGMLQRLSRIWRFLFTTVQDCLRNYL